MTEKCEVCGWVDKKPLKWATIKPHERLALHMWAHHGHPLPFQTKEKPASSSE